MKLKLQYKLPILFLLLPFIALANTKIDEHLLKTTKEKTYHKSYDVSANATLKVTNSFGNLNIVTWDENRIEIDVLVKVTGNSADKVQDRLESIAIEFSGSSDYVSAITKIGKKKSSWWSWGKKANLKLEINYTIKMPVTNDVNLNNEFGAINLGRLEGSAKISCDFGKITTKELMSNDNVISFDHTKNTYIEYVNNAEIRANHSSYTVEKAKSVTIRGDHTQSTIENAEAVNYRCDFGTMKIDNVNILDGRGDHLTLRVNNLYKNLKLRANHGTIKVEKIASGANLVDINSEFIGLSLGYDSGFNFNFDINLEYGSLRNADDFNFRNKSVDSFTKRYEGYYGADNSGNTIKIRSEHGSVSFKKQ